MIARLTLLSLSMRLIFFVNKHIFFTVFDILPFTTVPGIMVVRMVLHIIKFVNGFSCGGGVNHFCLVKSWQIVAYMIATPHCLLGSIAKFLKMLSHETVSLQGRELQFCWAVQATSLVIRSSLFWIPVTPATFLVVRSSLLWIPVTLLSDISGLPLKKSSIGGNKCTKDYESNDAALGYF